MLDVRRIVARFPAAVSRSAVEPTKPPIRRKPATISRGLKRNGRDLDHSSHLVQLYSTILHSTIHLYDVERDNFIFKLLPQSYEVTDNQNSVKDFEL
jgi:hypothetical protein